MSALRIGYQSPCCAESKGVNPERMRMQDFGYRSIQPVGNGTSASERKFVAIRCDSSVQRAQPSGKFSRHYTANLTIELVGARKIGAAIGTYEKAIHEHSTLERHLYTLPMETSHPGLHRRSRSRRMVDGAEIRRRFPKAEMPSFLHYIGLYVTLSALYPRNQTLCKIDPRIPLMHYETERYADVQRSF